MSNDEFQEALPRSLDPAVREIQWEAWYLYDDLQEHSLTGRWRIPREGRREIAQWILFLRSNKPYEWPETSLRGVFPFIVLNILTLGLAGYVSRKWFSSKGDISAWPFVRQGDLEEAKRNPVYLSGR